MTNTIQFWPGAEGIKAVYERSLEEKQVDFIIRIYYRALEFIPSE